ncbi:WXG100 family type VII secretion target [Glycomyces arizonensis]|uniref:WXG100 family type VII secretion target n=1 Tax=Glycomyces arizonensis TaxID=256035 RepID=UPI0003FCECB4|nr:hypothetical protein [Glycomyces arizonensis]
MSDATFSNPTDTGIYTAESGPSATSGLRLGDSLTNVGKDLMAAGSEDFSGTALAIDGTVAALDVLAFALNPFKEFIMAGVGWIIEHVDWLREPLEMLTGDSAAITAISQTWSNISQAFDNAGTDMAGFVEQLAAWQGEAAEAYRDTTTAFAEMLSGTASAAQAVSGCYAAIGIVAATVKAIVMELLCEFVSRVIIILLGALASAALTFGGSIGVGIAMTIESAVETSARIGAKVAQMLAKVGELLGKIGKARNAFGKLSSSVFDAVDGVAGNLGKLIRNFDGMFDDFIKKNASILKIDLYTIPPGTGDPARGAYDQMADAFTGPDSVDDILRNSPNAGRVNPILEAEDIAGGITATGFRGTITGVKDGDASTEADIDDRT